MSKHKELQPQSLSLLENRDATRLDSHRPIKVQVVEGAAYVTREGDATDYILRAGDKLCFDERGTVVIQGFPCAEYQVSA
jgi:hypothetical protein